MRIWSRLSIASLVLCGAITSPAFADQALGSGSTFVYPVMSAWCDAFRKLHGGDIAYEPIGSSAGITEVREGVVDFAASEAPLSAPDLAAGGFMQFPVVIGGIVPVVDLDGVGPGRLRFTGPLLADIYLGRIVNWRDPAIAAANPGVALPDRRITVVYRTDGSGTTFNWANYLSQVSDEWKQRVGAGTKVSWPTGVGANGNGGVAEAVARIKGAIGYVEFGYAVKRKMAYAAVRNRAGVFVMPDSASFAAAAESADWAAARDFYLLMTDAPGPTAYPIVATSFVLMPKHPGAGTQNKVLLAFFGWALSQGQAQADALGYVPLPPPLVARIEAYWRAQLP
jgi:phosphate transport system substrate-binding protein